MHQRFRWLGHAVAALVLLVAAPPAFARGTAWRPITGAIQWSCGGRVEAWATWQAQYANGQATGATRDEQRHTAGTCPSGPGGAAWHTVTGNIAWPCAGVETWATWQAAYLHGRATGATRDFQSFASGACSGAAGGGAAAGTRPVATLTLPFAPRGLSLGPAAGDLAATDGRRCVVVLGGRVAQTIPLCDFIAWVPGSRWVVHNALTPPTIQGSVVRRFVALRYAGGTAGVPVTIPCSGGLPASVQPVSGPAVAYVCRGALHTLALGKPGATPRTYSLPAGLGQARLLVDPTGTYAAALRRNGWVNVYRLADGSELPGTYLAGTPLQAAWSNNGTLALINAAGGLTLWRPGVGVVSLATPDHPYGYRLLWQPGGPGVLALSTLLTGLGGAPSGGVVAGPGGTVRPFAPALPRGDVVLALAPGGRDLWYGSNANGQAAGAYTMSEAPLP